MSDTHQTDTHQTEIAASLHEYAALELLQKRQLGNRALANPIHLNVVGTLHVVGTLLSWQRPGDSATLFPDSLESGEMQQLCAAISF